MSNPNAMIPSTVRETLLNTIMDGWKRLEPQWRPDRMWVREYATTNEAGDGIPSDTWPVAYWVLDQNGLQEQCVIQWRRLESVHFGFPLGLLPRKMSETGRPMNYENGLASFAPLPETGWYYYEYVYGPTWGRGLAARIDLDGTVLEEKNLWLS